MSLTALNSFFTTPTNPFLTKLGSQSNLFQISSSLAYLNDLVFSSIPSSEYKSDHIYEACIAQCEHNYAESHDLGELAICTAACGALAGKLLNSMLSVIN